MGVRVKLGGHFIEFNDWITPVETMKLRSAGDYDALVCVVSLMLYV